MLDPPDDLENLIAGGGDQLLSHENFLSPV
jgi:hypothetical protein